MQKNMNDWYVKNLGDAILAEQSLEQIKKLFYPKYRDSNEPEAMAVFVRHESEGRLHCEAWVYFSPAAAAVAKTVDAVPCQKPSREGLGLLAGPDSAWPLLFDGNDID